MNLIEQLKQRRITQRSIDYVAAAIALLQGLEIVARQFAWSEWVQRATTLALAFGHSVALVIAWFHGKPAISCVDEAGGFPGARVKCGLVNS